MSTTAFSYRIPSAIPGRIRLQIVPSAAGHVSPATREAALKALAEPLRALPVAPSVEVATAADSLILRYDAAALPLKSLLRQFLSLVEIEPEGKPEPAAATTRTRTNKFAAAKAQSTTANTPSAGRESAKAAFAPLQRQFQPVTSAVVPALKAAVHRVPGQQERISAVSMPPEKPRGFKGMLMPTVAVALAATELLPVAITGAALAVATIPILQRAAKGVAKRQLTVDELDLAAVALLAVEGSFLAAGAVTWLVTFGEWVRGETVRHSRERLIQGDENEERTRRS